jgi:hypothetical protein
VSSYTVYDLDAPSRNAEALHYFRCNRVCKGVTVTAFFPGRYYQCGCGAQALYQFSVPVDTDERRALHAAGVTVARPPAEKWTCVRCGKDGTGTLRNHRADGLACNACYEAEMAPEDDRMAEQIRAFVARQKAAQDAEVAATREKYKHLFREEQSINQQTPQESK